ncbi:DUF349 domain-containing protein [Leadbetterella byssophila]|uniref:DUF349 domain-containing protein n=1 Tax=Leadbetterella byssophila (strain DSM 17132 / JCM 16389 / KACC 11308 / NBRC 106382 / 4M15) TaxID=649349 RepID=E4RWB1_LEAB4|nr:DUF349 domain-containing protein [Leadbetterella byssophila]ADQ17146.1 protein of unknown function DUF349 [Leadbetterella byssophila DSM 17132]
MSESSLEPENLGENNGNAAEQNSASEETVKHADLDAIEEIEEEGESLLEFDEDFTNYSKKDFVDLADRLLESMNSRTLSVADVKNIDNALKVVRSAFEDIQQAEKSEALKAYVAENGSDEGFEFRNDNYAIRFEGINIQIREKRQAFFQKLEREKEDYFEVKTRLLQRLREIVEIEEKGESKNNWESFKALQTEWKNAGNINSPHNGSLWSAYNALVDRYFDIRSIQNELKELDRKKNIEAKEAVVVKIEEIATSLQEMPINNVTLKKANELLQEYKHIGPGPREEQDALWERLKKAFDVIYDKKRELQSESAALSEEILKAKQQLLNQLLEYLKFNSDSINEWNAKTKEVQALQDQWNAIKGGMPREKGKEVSKSFWSSLKQFFKNKSEFFAKLEAKREANFVAKSELVKQAREILEKGDYSAPNTNRIIELQKKWKTIGHVPEKYKDSLFEEFKGICDTYFNNKREESKSQDSEYDKNLEAKTAICVEIEKLVEAGDTDLSRLPEFKKSFNAIGFVPRKDMKSIQDRFIKAINSYVKAASGLDKTEKDKLMLQNEAEVVLKAGGNLGKAENDIRRKIKALEDEITLTKNNLEFFGFSKNADKLKAEYQKKIDKAEAELKDLNAKLKLILTAN